jgi:hypothetical protein
MPQASSGRRGEDVAVGVRSDGVLVDREGKRRLVVG